MKNLRTAMSTKLLVSVKMKSDPELSASVRQINGLIQLDLWKIPVATTEPKTIPP